MLDAGHMRFRSMGEGKESAKDVLLNAEAAVKDALQGSIRHLLLT